MANIGPTLSKYTGAAELSALLESDKFGIISVKTYGAKGDGVTDDTTAIQDAITEASNLAESTFKPILYFPSSNGYVISSSITIPKNINVIMYSEMIYVGSSNITALTIGSAGSANVNINVKLDIRVRKQITSDWTSENSIGVKIINLNSSDVKISQAQGFTIGVQCIGDGQGFAYNNVELLYIIDNKIGLDCNNDNGGWCNENVFINGRFGVFSSTNTSKARYGIRITSKVSYYNNNNFFIKPSIELLASTTSQEAIPILIEYGNQNEFISIRDEGNDTPTMRVSNNSTDNALSAGYGIATIEDDSTYPTNIVKARRFEIWYDNLLEIYRVSNMHKNVTNYNGSTEYMLPGVSFVTLAGSPVLSSTNISVSENYVSPYYGIGVYVDTSRTKKFVVRVETEEGYGGRVNVSCFDSTGKKLTSSDSGHPYVKNASFATFFYASNFGGTYRSGSDTSSPVYFAVGDDVKKIQLIIGSGTNALRIRGFSLYALENTLASVNTGVVNVLDNARCATADPITGTFLKGVILWNGDPDSAEYIGRVCTVSGTQGTLNGGATTGDITSGTTILTVNDANGLKVDDYITIAGVSGVKRVIIVNGTTITISSSADATVTGAAIAYSNATFKTFGLIS